MLQIENRTQQFYRYSKLIQLQEIEHSIKQRISSRIKRAPSVNTLVEATAKNDFSYWLSQEDIADIARIEYNQFRIRTENNAEFEILGSMTQLSSTVKSFQEKIKTNKWSKALLTLIMNLENLHWVTMLISYKNNNYVAYYVDSKNNPIPQNYFELLYNPYLIHPIINLNSGYMQQKDGFNCGLWALENAVVLNAMFDHKEPLDWLSKALRRVHDKNYFEGKRILLSEKLINDPLWKERHLNFVHPDEISKKTQLLEDSFTLDKIAHDSKRLKASPDKEKEKVAALLDVFVTTFLSFFLKNIGIYHLLAKEKRLTKEALKAEIKTGATSALFGVYIADSLVGLIPGLVASLRAISGKYYISKDKAQKITHFFSNVESGNLDSMLAEVAVNIFYSFESQFMQVTDKAGEKVAIEKLAEDAVERIFNAINKFYDVNSVFSKQLLEEGMLKGASEKFFDPNIKEIALTTSGYMILNKEGKKINTSKLYEHTGLVELGANNQPNKFYATKKYSRHRYGYRRLFDWEKEANGELKKNLKEQYVNDQFLQAHDIFQFHLRKYSYVLSQETNQAEASRLLDKIKSYQFSKPVIKEQTNKKSIYFNLKKPVKNFSGRIEILTTLHHTLISERTIAIVPNWSALSISSDKNIAATSGSDSSSASSGSLLSISGLGGIGKTQLALRYAELYAQHYDHNVLWIDAETVENINYSFKKLSKKLEISISDYGQEKTLEEIVENAYAYFSDRKSLFIFDNVENYRAIETYLPKSRPDNKPTVLITSRYANWDNVATTMKLNVFTEHETQELIQKSLGFQEHTPLEIILQLNQLLQGLPLALQQALAYIKLQIGSDSLFSFKDYIELYKEKKKELLNFDFKKYSNDPYLETVFTTWLITLCKIKSNPMGEDAIEVLNIMAYLNPDSISIKKFEYLNKIYSPKLFDLPSITFLLSSYSMINSHSKKNVYAIHRLVQQVIRINLEENQEKFKALVEKTQLLFWHWQFSFKKDQEVFFHYLHFLIYMAEHKDLIGSLLLGHPEEILFDNLILKSEKERHYFVDLAYLKFTKEKFLNFAGDAIAYYIKCGLFFSLSEILNYLEKKWSINSFSKENIKYITEYVNNMSSKIKLKRFSTNPVKKEAQKKAILLFYEFNYKIFGNMFFKYDSCSFHSLKRSICSLSETEQERVKELRKQPIKAHFKKIEQISRYISSALMTKDTLSALIQGHFNEVAINFGLMTSSLFFGKISNSMLTQGKNLASDASLLEKNLGLENKKVLSILFNENVSSMGKRQFLGKALQAASPFVAKATSIYFAYNLKNEIHAYRMGNKDVLPNIISNSVILSIDGIEAGIEGAEFLGFITGISAFTGPLGEGIALLVWLGVEGYAAKQQVEAIEKYVHLSRGEKFFEFLLSTLHLAPLEYIQLKANNGQLVERAINFLKDNTAIQWTIFPAFTFVEDTCKIRKAFLKEKINFTPDDNNPDKPAEGDLFCLSAAPPPYEALNIKMKYYLCHKTLGVSYALNRTGNGTLVDLGEGEDEVIAFSDSPTLFIVQNGKKRYLGGDNGNVFNLQGNSIAGLLQGGNETDILVLDKFHPENSDYLLLDTDGFLCGKNKAAMQSIPPFCVPDEIRVQIDRIDHIYGRKNESDILYLDQDVRFIDGYGGKNQTHPDNFFITDRSYKNLEFVLRNNTLITFLSNPTIDSISYRIPSGEIGESWIHYYFKETIQHRFFFEYFLHEVDLISIQDNTVHISILVGEDKDKKTFSLSISEALMTLEVNQTHNTAQHSKNFYYLFKDFEIKLISNEHLYGKEITDNNQTMDEKISLFRAIANRLEKTFSIQLINNLTLSIGREKKHEIFYINGAYENHLVGNGGENVYTILSDKKIVFPVSNIVLYETLNEDSNELLERIDTLDLREIIKEYKQIYPKAVISSHVFPSANDLILTLSNSVYSPVYQSSYESNCFKPWLTIQLKNALFNNSHWYQKLDIFFDILPKNIVPLDDEVWSLATAPLLFTDDKKIIIITYQDIEEKSEIYIWKSIGNYAFFRDEADLILTNAFPSSMDYCTIICRSFYQEPEMRKKIVSATFKFFDQAIRPQDYQQEIEHATHFSYLSQLFSSNSPNVSDIIAHTFFNTVGMQNQKKLPPQKKLRRKRQAHQEEKIIVDTIQSSTSTKKNSKQTNQTFFHDRNHASQSIGTDEEDRILTMADDYLEKYDSSLRKKSYRNTKKLNQKKNKNKRKDVFPSVRGKDKPNIAKYGLLNQKNNANYFQPITQNYFASKTLKTLPKFQTEKQLRLTSKSESTNTKDNFFKNSHFDKNKSFHKTNKFLPQENLRLEKTRSIYPKLPYEQNQSGSKPNSHSFSIQPHTPNTHNTLIFLDFVVRKSLRNPIVPVSLDKKLNKNIKRAIIQKDKLNNRTYFNSKSIT